MYMDFHTHGKLAKYLPFSTEYTDWLLREARRAGLDAICLTEHFNTQQFDTLYGYVEARGEKNGDAYVFEDAGGLRVFPGMETDIAEGGHVLCVGPMEAIREMNRRLEPHKAKDRFLPAAQLLELFAEYPVLVGAGHPFRDGGHIPDLPPELLMRFDFLDLNGKDIAEDRQRTEELTFGLGQRLGKPVVAGSDTHQAVQYGCIRTCFEHDFASFDALAREMKAGRYSICVHPDAEVKVRTAGLLKRALKGLEDRDRAAQVRAKGPTDFVTAVDTEVQERIRALLQALDGTIQFMAEEKDNAAIDPARPVWVLDPVDGTTNLIHGFRHSAISLALAEGGRVCLGLVFDPFAGELFAARRGGGAFCNGRPIHASGTVHLADSLCSVGTNPGRREEAGAAFARARRIYDRCHDIRRIGAASIELCYTACGRLDAYLEHGLNPWDYAAGWLILEEAGGRLTTWDGKTPSLAAASCAILATNGRIHEELLALV